MRWAKRVGSAKFHDMTFPKGEANSVTLRPGTCRKINSSEYKMAARRWLPCVVLRLGNVKTRIGYQRSRREWQGGDIDLPLPRTYIRGRCMVAVFYGMCFGCFSGSTREQLRPYGVLHVAHAMRKLLERT